MKKIRPSTSLAKRSAQEWGRAVDASSGTTIRTALLRYGAQQNYRRTAVSAPTVVPPATAQRPSSAPWECQYVATPMKVWSWSLYATDRVSFTTMPTPEYL